MKKLTKNKSSLSSHRPFSYLTLVTVLFASSLITANVIAVKIVTIFGFFVPAGIIVFPIAYIIGDVITEVYGFRQAKRIIWLGFGANLLFVTFASIAGSLPAAPFWHGSEAYSAILGYTPRLLVASFIAYLAGSFSNSYVLAVMKVITKSKYLWTRTIGSTIVGEGLDSLVFIFIAFVGTIPGHSLITLILTQWTMKVLYETIATPLTYMVIHHIKTTEGVDVTDVTIPFNLFSTKSTKTHV